MTSGQQTRISFKVVGNIEVSSVSDKQDQKHIHRGKQGSEDGGSRGREKKNLL